MDKFCLRFPALKEQEINEYLIFLSHPQDVSNCDNYPSWDANVSSEG